MASMALCNQVRHASRRKLVKLLRQQCDLSCALEAMIGGLNAPMQGGTCRSWPARAAKAKSGSKAAAKASSGHGAFFRKASA